MPWSLCGNHGENHVFEAHGSGIHAKSDDPWTIGLSVDCGKRWGRPFIFTRIVYIYEWIWLRWAILFKKELPKNIMSSRRPYPGDPSGSVKRRKTKSGSVACRYGRWLRVCFSLRMLRRCIYLPDTPSTSVNLLQIAKSREVQTTSTNHEPIKRRPKDSRWRPEREE